MDSHLGSVKCREATNAISLRDSHLSQLQIPSVQSHIPPSGSAGCVGAHYKWDIGSVFTTYPFPIHDPTSHHSPGYILLSIDFVSAILHVHSMRCFSEWYQFQIKAALKRNNTKPSTNVPLKCLLCLQVHWKYNMGRHLQDKHPTWDVTTEEATRRVLRTMITLMDKEESQLGVSQTVQPQLAPNPNPQGATTGHKHPPNLPTGTPRRHRVLRTSAQQVVDVGRQHSQAGSSSNGDVFT
ncbi:hypothetical protein B0H10DRAFT_1939763 [Mycena sp. CBHHK59/15]|nr:hypothetical protein B0H10DRAFT_1939763 [Mycena sp. CBHHK59/15]